MESNQKIIGITGNIATGKSVVRRMLANCGALEIDGDALGHRVIYPEGPVFNQVVSAFGNTILADDGRISRSELGEIVFNDPEKLQKLESLSHPAVTQSILTRIQQSRRPLIVIEAIKLLEAGLDEICSEIWISHASEDHQMQRLMQTRNMSEGQAKHRILMQPPQSEKINQADVIINTEGNFLSTWNQIQDALNDTIQLSTNPVGAHLNSSTDWTYKPINLFSRKIIEDFWEDHSKGSGLNLYQLLGMQMILPIMETDQLKTLLAWENWNFTARFINVFAAEPFNDLYPTLLEIFQAHAQSQQAEILLIPDDLNQELSLDLADFGFQRRMVDEIAYPAWRQSAEKIVTHHDDLLWMKIVNEPVEIKGGLANNL